MYLVSTEDKKRTAVSDFVLERNVDIFCVTESWLRSQGEEGQSAKACRHPDGPLLRFLVHHLEVASPLL